MGAGEFVNGGSVDHALVVHHREEEAHAQPCHHALDEDHSGHGHCRGNDDHSCGILAKHEPQVLVPIALQISASGVRESRFFPSEVRPSSCDASRHFRAMP